MPGLQSSLRSVYAAARTLGRTQVPDLRAEKCRARPVSVLGDNGQRKLRGYFLWLRVSLIVRDRWPRRNFESAESKEPTS